MIPVPFRAGLSARILFIPPCVLLWRPCFHLLFKRSCGRRRLSILEYLKTHGAPDAKEVKIDLFHTDKQVPDKAYAGVMTTYTFGSGSGELQREYSGYILRREGGQWTVEENTSYTKDAQKAAEILQGKGKKSQ